MKKQIIYLGIIILALFTGCAGELIPEPIKDTRAEISRVWTCNDVDDKNFTRTYEVTIAADSDSTGIKMTNFNNFGDPSKIVKAKITGSTITIPTQYVGASKIDGTGTISNQNQRIDWNYKVVNSGITFTMKASFTPPVIPVKKSFNP